MKKIMIFLGFLGCAGVSVASEGNRFIPRTVLSREDQGRFNEVEPVLSREDQGRFNEVDFDAFLDGLGLFLTRDLPSDPFTTPIMGSSGVENQRPGTPAEQVGRRGRDCPGSAQSICTPEAEAPRQAVAEQRAISGGAGQRRPRVEGGSEQPTQRSRGLGGFVPRPRSNSGVRCDSEDEEDDSGTLCP